MSYTYFDPALSIHNPDPGFNPTMTNSYVDPSQKIRKHWDANATYAPFAKEGQELKPGEHEVVVRAGFQDEEREPVTISIDGVAVTLLRDIPHILTTEQINVLENAEQEEWSQGSIYEPLFKEKIIRFPFTVVRSGSDKDTFQIQGKTSGKRTSKAKAQPIDVS